MQRQLTGPRHLGRDPYPLPVRLSVLAPVPRRRAGRTRRAAAVAGAGFWPWVLDGALTQIAATALMLLAMNERSFVVTTAYLKTEPIQVAIFGFVFLGDPLTSPMVVAILIATAGVMIMSTAAGRRNGRRSGADADRPRRRRLFALSAIGFRGAILSPDLSIRDGGDLYAGDRAVHADAAAVDLSLAARARRARGDLRAWKPSLFAGFMGAFASQFWFLAFALTTAANVRTLALVEVLFAQGSRASSFKQPL